MARKIDLNNFVECAETVVERRLIAIAFINSGNVYFKEFDDHEELYREERKELLK